MLFILFNLVQATCNNAHEMSMASHLSSDSLTLVSSGGSWRDAWMVENPTAASDQDVDAGVILKTMK